MSKVQLTIVMDTETKQQIEAAAAKQQITIDDYVTAAVLRRLAYDGLEATTPLMTIEESLQHLERMSALRESILAERNGELIDVNAIIDLVREERDAELYPIEDGQLGLEQSDSVRRSIFDPERLQEIDRLHAAILERRGGEPIDIDAAIDQMRDDRDSLY